MQLNTCRQLAVQFGVLAYLAALEAEGDIRHHPEVAAEVAEGVAVVAHAGCQLAAEAAHELPDGCLRHDIGHYRHRAHKHSVGIGHASGEASVVQTEESHAPLVRQPGEHQAEGSHEELVGGGAVACAPLVDHVGIHLFRGVDPLSPGLRNLRCQTGERHSAEVFGIVGFCPPIGFRAESSLFFQRIIVHGEP